MLSCQTWTEAELPCSSSDLNLGLGGIKGFICWLHRKTAHASYQVFGLLLLQVPDVHRVDHFLWREETRSDTRNH